MKHINNILLVDDNSAANNHNKVLLESIAQVPNIEIKDNGKQALDFILKKKEPETIEEIDQNLIILNLYMNGMDGVGFLREYNKLPKSLKDKYVIWVLSSGVKLSTNVVDSLLNDYLVDEVVEKPLEDPKLEVLLEKYF